MSAALVFTLLLVLGLGVLGLGCLGLLVTLLRRGPGAPEAKATSSRV